MIHLSKLLCILYLILYRFCDFLFPDDGGVFKAKQTNRQTYGAREVRETRDTRVDLPIDQVPAEEVKVSTETHYQMNV